MYFIRFRLKKTTSGGWELDIKEEDLPELINIISQPRFRPQAFLILAIVCSSLFQSCETSPATVKPKQKPEIELKNDFG
jgi:hypothetical protein